MHDQDIRKRIEHDRRIWSQFSRPARIIAGPRFGRALQRIRQVVQRNDIIGGSGENSAVLHDGVRAVSMRRYACANPKRAKSLGWSSTQRFKFDSAIRIARFPSCTSASVSNVSVLSTSVNTCAKVLSAASHYLPLRPMRLRVASHPPIRPRASADGQGSPWPRRVAPGDEQLRIGQTRRPIGGSSSMDLFSWRCASVQSPLDA